MQTSLEPQAEPGSYFKVIRPRALAAKTARSAVPGARADESLAFRSADLAPPPPAPGQPDNLLLASVKDDDVIVDVPFDQDSNLEIGDHVFLRIDNKDYNQDGEWVAIQAYDVPIPVTVPAAWRGGDGRHTIQYRYQFVTGAGNFEDGPMQSFSVDTVAPGAPQLAPPDLDVNGDLLIPPDLQPDGSLSGTISGYTDLQPGDVVQLSIDGADVGSPIPVDRIPGPGEYITILYPSAAIDSLTDGAHDFGYSVIDRAGNRSAPSKPTRLSVIIEGYLGALEAPLVPEARNASDQDATHSGLIDLADALSDGGVTIDIPSHPKYAQQTFQYRLWWGSKISEPVDMPPQGTLSLVPFAVVAEVWEPSGSNPDRANSVQVRYTVELNGTTVGASPEVKVWVNLHAAGGVDPAPDTPENENLAPPVVTSASGETDYIPLEDFTEDGTIEAAGLALDPASTPVFVGGDEVTFHFGNSTLDRTVDPSEAGASISVTLPATAIAAEGTGDISAWYVIRRAAHDQNGDPFLNETTSPSKKVRVEGPGDLPGGGKPLPPVTWKEAGSEGNPPDIIGANEARKLVTLEIAPYDNKKVGDKIRLTLPLYPRFGHSNGEAPIAGRSFTKDVPTKGTNEATSVQFSEDELMYYKQDNLTMHAHITYTVVGEGLPDDKAVTSDELVLRVDSRGDRPTA